MRVIIFCISLFFLSASIISCSAITKIDRSVTQKVLDDKEKRDQDSMDRAVWIKKYLDVLCFNMQEYEFVNHFTKISSWADPERPYITKHVGNKYIVSGLESSYDYRMTFEDGVLVKFEYHGHGGGGNPFGYNDATFQLKGCIL